MKNEEQDGKGTKKENKFKGKKKKNKSIFL